MSKNISLILLLFIALVIDPNFHSDHGLDFLFAKDKSPMDEK